MGWLSQVGEGLSFVLGDGSEWPSFLRASQCIFKRKAKALLSAVLLTNPRGWALFIHFTGEDAKQGASCSLRWQKRLREAERVCRMNSGRGEARSVRLPGGSDWRRAGLFSRGRTTEPAECGLWGQVTGLQVTPVPQFLDPSNGYTVGGGQ